MRLDKWLKVSRLIKRRTVANEACDNERISANGRVVKASYEVKIGDFDLPLKEGQILATREELEELAIPSAFKTYSDYYGLRKERE